MLLVKNNDRVGNNANHDGRHTVEHVGGEANDIAEAVAAIFRDVNTRTYSDRYSKNTRQRKNEGRANDGIGHPTACLAYRSRSLSEKSPVDRTDAAVEKVAKDSNKWREHQDDREHGEAGHQMIDEAAAQSNGRDRMQ